MKNKIIAFSLLVSSFSILSAQQKAIITGAPFLRIAPDARAGGLADQGVATTPDVNSQYWNASKYVFSKDRSGVAFSYTPYMNKITNDVFLLNGSFYTFLGEEERSTLSASIYYFNLGEIKLSQLLGTEIQRMGTAKPNEFSIDLAYGLKLADTYSMSVTARYIRSDLFNNASDNTSQTKVANTVGVDVAGYFQTMKMPSFGSMDGRIRAGWGIYNIGPKLDYSKDSENSSYLPTNLRLGAGYDLFIDEDNRLSLNLELAKLLVPSPKKEIDPITGDVVYRMPDKDIIGGMFSSFGDAEGGFSEEMKEMTYSIAAEYEFRDAFAFRAGYFHESPQKGARQYITLGAGLKYESFGVDASYLITTSDVNSALDNTLRIGVSWTFGGPTEQADY